MESIVQDLRELSPKQLVEVASYVRRMNPVAAATREEVLRDTHGYLDEQEGAVFEDAFRRHLA